MRIAFKGRTKPDELVGEISEMLVQLADLGVEELESINLYCQPWALGVPVELQTLDGRKADVLTVQRRQVGSYALREVARSSQPGAARQRGGSR